MTDSTTPFGGLRTRGSTRKRGPALLGPRLLECRHDGATSVEQQSNLYHLLSQVLAYGVSR